MISKLKQAIYCGGCFWGVQYYLGKIKGVNSTFVGYIGGSINNPTYKDVCKKTTGHFEGVFVDYNPEIVSYEKLTKTFFEIHDFT